MKKTAFVLALLAVSVTAGAQRNDLYSTGKVSKTAASVQTVKQVTTVQPATAAVTSSADAFDTDNYNRRYTSAPAAVTSGDGAEYYNPVYIHDTVFMILDSQKGSSYDSYAYHEGYTDAVEDFYATRLITRFHRRGLTLSLALDPYYYDAWYWNSWYYDPFYYDWYYDRYYYGYRYYDSWYYRPYRHYYSYSRPAYVDRHYATAPNRHVNSSRGGGWDSSLSGRTTYSTRSVSSGLSLVGERSGSGSNRNVAVQHSAERRGTVTSNAGRTTTGTRSVNSSTGTRSVSSSTGTRSVNSSTGTRSEAGQLTEYDRPSSTAAKNVSNGNRSVSRSVSGNSTRNAGTGNRGENVQSRSVSGSSNTRSVSSNTSTTTSPARSVSSGNTSRSVSAGSSGFGSSSGGGGRSTGSSHGISGSASRR